MPWQVFFIVTSLLVLAGGCSINSDPRGEFKGFGAHVCPEWEAGCHFKFRRSWFDRYEL